MTAALAYLHLAPGTALPPFPVEAPFAAAIITDVTVPETWRDAVAAKLVADGCLWTTSWGVDSQAWEDAVDDANLVACDFDVPDGKLVLTTSHPTESLEEALWFVQSCALHRHTTFEHILIVHVSVSEARERLLGAAAAASRLVD